MSQAWDGIVASITRYIGQDIIYLVFLVALIALCIIERKHKDRWYVLGVYSICVLLIIFNPVVYYVMANYFIGGGVYWRMCWILPVNIVIAYVITRMIGERKAIGSRVALFLTGILVVVSCGSYMFTNDNYKKSENIYKLSQKVIDVSEGVLEQKENPVVIADSELSCYMRQYTPKIKQIYRRAEVFGSKWSQVADDIVACYANGDYPYLFQIGEENQCDIIVIPKSGGTDIRDTVHGYKKVKEVGEYYIYQRE